MMSPSATSVADPTPAGGCGARRSTPGASLGMEATVGLDPKTRQRLFRNRPMAATEKFLIRRKLLAETRRQLAAIDADLAALSAQRANLMRFVSDLESGRDVR